MKVRSRKRRWLLTTVVMLVLLPLVPLLVLRWLPPPTSAFMLQARFGGLGDAPACEVVHQRWLAWEQIPEHAKMAVVAAEDQRFAHHWGIDLESVADALREGQDGSMRGASTISQQVSKNLFLWPGRSWLRKSLEAYLTVWMELIWPKQRILEVYLNIAQFDDCVFGVAAASERLFGVSPQRLRLGQAALLAAVLPNPARLHADRPSDYVRERARWIEGQVRQLGGGSYLDRL